MKDASRRVFLDFWGEPAGSPRRDRDGVYASYVFGPPGQRVQVILPDLRYNRTAMMPMELGGASYEAWAREARRLGPAAAGTVRAQSRPEGDDARRTPVAMARTPARGAGGASPLRLERAGARRLHRLGGLGQLRARPAIACSTSSAASARTASLFLSRRHPLRRAVEARGQRALHALGPDLERPHRGMARADAERQPRERSRRRRELRLHRHRLAGARPPRSRSASSMPRGRTRMSRDLALASLAVRA